MKDKLIIGRLVLEIGASGAPLMKETISEFFGGVSVIHTLVIRGMASGLVEKMQYIKKKLDDVGIVVGTIETEIVI